MKKPAINELLQVMAKLRSPEGCPWDREQDHQSLRRHAVEEVYELIDAIEAGDDHEMAGERGAFDFERVTRLIVEKLIRRHPHVFGDTKVKNVDEVWTNWEKIKKAEKHGTRHERASALDGIPRHLPALARAEKLVKKARKANLIASTPAGPRLSKPALARELFRLAESAQTRGWSAEELLAAEVKKQEKSLRRRELGAKVPKSPKA
jgi:uncharacterized protein YabN with tetrapyrrole methylase and pyrophosphatase domain